jgi:hypothetical protein
MRVIVLATLIFLALVTGASLGAVAKFGFGYDIANNAR